MDSDEVVSDPMATMSEDDYDRQWRSEVKRALNALNDAQQQTTVTVNRVDDRLKDLIQQLDNKISRDVYEGMMARLNDRLVRLEGGTQKAMAWFALIFSGCSVAIAATAFVGGVILYMINHH